MRKLYFFVLLMLPLCISAQTDSHKRLFLLLGQSNMAGRAPIEQQDTAPLPLVKILNAEGRFETARNPLNIFSNIRKKAGVQKLGLGYTFAKTVAEYLQDTIYLIVNARGGEALERFMKNDSTRYYEKTIFRVKQALRNSPDLRLEAIIWHQGESNRDDFIHYLPRLKQLVSDFRNDLAVPSLPFIAGELGCWNTAYQSIVKKIGCIPDSIPNAFLISSEQLTPIDEFHFDSASQRVLGERYAKQYIQILKK